MKKLYEESDVQAIAAAIREKTGGSATYTIAQMAAAILGIEAGGGGGGALEPYIEYTYTTVDGEKQVETAKMHGCTEITNYAFYNCSWLTTVSGMDGVTAIRESASTGAQVSNWHRCRIALYLLPTMRS